MNTPISHYYDSMALMKSFHSILVLVMVALNHCTVWGSRSTSKSLNKLLSLKPIDITGVYRLGRKGNVGSWMRYFWKANLDVISDEGDAVTVCDLYHYLFLGLSSVIRTSGPCLR